MPKKNLDFSNNNLIRTKSILEESRKFYDRGLLLLGLKLPTSTIVINRAKPYLTCSASQLKKGVAGMPDDHSSSSRLKTPVVCRYFDYNPSGNSTGCYKDKPIERFNMLWTFSAK